ncbi:MAG: hypothetical protein WC343_06580 [Bacilli bacterium]|jgi:hypothetical protein
MAPTCKTCKCRDCINRDDCLTCENCHDEMLTNPITRTYCKITPTLHTLACEQYHQEA